MIDLRKAVQAWPSCVVVPGCVRFRDWEKDPRGNFDEDSSVYQNFFYC
jgi:hypothetical protein